MDRSPRLVLQFSAIMAVVTFWFLAAFIISWFVTYTELVEMFLLTLAFLLLAFLSVILMSEVSKLKDLKHRQSTQRRLRELQLWERSHHHLSLPRYKRSSRSR